MRISIWMEWLVRAEKEGNPANIPYLFGFDYEHSGFLVLAFLPSSEIFKERVKVTSEGYHFRRQQFKSINELIEYFKKKAIAGASRSTDTRFDRNVPSHHQRSVLPPPPFANYGAPRYSQGVNRYRDDAYARTRY